MSLSIQQVTDNAIKLLQQLVATPSLSRQENDTADILENFLKQHGIDVQRQQNNVWAITTNCPPNAKTVLLNSHHDTVKPAQNWLTDPFTPVLSGDKLIGLGSNDAGASAVALLATFLYLNQQEQLPVRYIVAITAEEEISGPNGIRSILKDLGNIDLGIVGEPTHMNMAVAEKGLIVLDCVASGKTGHAARNEGINALYKAVEDINWIKNYAFEKVSPFLGKTKMTATQIQAGTQHNVVPDQCSFVVDVRTNELYSNTEVVELIQKHISSKVTPRSTHLNSSRIEIEHPLVKKGIAMDKETYGSPTLSDQAVMDFPTVKIGVGDSARSHTPNEYILLSEIRAGIKDYIQLLLDFQF